MISPIEDLEPPSQAQTSHEDKAQGQLKQIELEKQSQKSQKSQSSTRKLKQKPINTIEVLSDEEQGKIISERFREELLRVKIQEAKLTRSKQNILKVLYIELNFRNRTDHEKELRFNTMVKTYISKKLKTAKGEPYDMKNSFFFDKMVPKTDDTFVENEYLLYGCDLLPHKHIEKMFQKYTPSIKWINASHCRLTFLSKTHGWDAVVNNCLNFESLRKDVLASERVQKLMDNLELESERQMEGQHQTKYNEQYAKIEKFKKQFHLLKDYVDLAPYYELEFKRRLMIRNCTGAQQLIGYDLNSDSKSQKSSKPGKAPSEKKAVESEFKKYLRVKEALWNEVENSPLVKPEYEKIEMQIQREEQILKYGKGKRFTPHSQYMNKETGSLFVNKQVYKGRHQNYEGREGSNFGNYPKRGNEYLALNDQRNRSRDHYQQERFKQGGYQGRNYDSHFDWRAKRKDMVEMAFDRYVEQRDGLEILNHPQKYIEPSFYDKEKRKTFYPNPFYNPQVHAQINSQLFPQLAQPYPDYSSEPALIKNPYFNIADQTSSGYEYEGNTQYLSGYEYEGRSAYPKAGSGFTKFYNQREGDSHFNPTAQYPGYPVSSQPYTSKNYQQKKPLNSTEGNFENYCAQRSIAATKVNIQTEIIPRKQPIPLGGKKIPSFKKSVLPSSSQLLFQADDFSIITEQKSKQQQERRQEEIAEDLENILDQINEEQQSVNSKNLPHYLQQNQAIPQQMNKDLTHNDDDGEDLDFILEERQNQFIKHEVKLESHSRMISNQESVIGGYIEEKIKQEHIPNWLKFGHDVNSFGLSKQLTNTNLNPQSSSQSPYNLFGSDPLIQKQIGDQSNQSIRRKSYPKKKRDEIHSQKKRDESNSQKKRQDHSLSKKARN